MLRIFTLKQTSKILKSRIRSQVSKFSFILLIKTARRLEIKYKYRNFLLTIFCLTDQNKCKEQQKSKSRKRLAETPADDFQYSDPDDEIDAKQ